MYNDERSGVGTEPVTLQRRVILESGRWSVRGCIPTLERGNDEKNIPFRVRKSELQRGQSIMLINTKNDSGAVQRSHIMFFFVIIVMICVAGYGYFSHVKHLIIEEKWNELTTIAKLKAEQIIQWRKERLGDAATIHNNTILADRLRDYLAGLAPPTTPDELKTWLETLRSSYGYHSAALYKADGTLLVSAIDADNKLDIISRRLIEDTVRKPVVFFSDIHKDEDDGEVHLNLVVPIGHTINKQFKTVAVLILDIDPQQFLYPLLKTWPTVSASSETLLVERRGEEIIFLNELRHRKGTALKLRVPLADTGMAAVRAALGQEGIFEGKDYRGVDVLSVARKIPGSSWAIVAKVDLSEISEPIKTQAWWVAIFSAMLMLGAGLGIYNRWSKQLVQVTLESEEKYRAVADNTYNWEYWKGVDESIVYCSPSCERISGYTADEFRVDPEQLIRIIHPDDRDRFRHHHDFDANGLTPADCQGMDFRILTRSGEERWIAHVCQEIFDGNGKSMGRRACNRDITIRKRTEEALSHNKSELKAIYDSVPVMLCLVDTDRRILYANHAFTLFTGISEEGLKGGHACGVFGCANALDDPRGCGFGINCSNCSLLKSIDDTFKTGNPHLNEEHNFKIAHHGYLQEFILLGSTVLIDSADKNCQLLCLQDITEIKQTEKLKRSEEALKIENGLFASLLKNLNVGVFMVEVPSGKAMLANEAALNLLGRGILPDATSSNLSEVYGAFKMDSREPYPVEKMPIILSMSGVTSHVNDMMVRRPDGTEIILEVFGSPVMDDQGRIWASLASFVDITAQKMAENSIKNHSKELEQRVTERTRSLEDANYELTALNSELDQRRLEAEENQRKMQQLSSAVVDSPTSVIITDSLGIIEYVNPKFTEITGYLPEEAIGRNPRILKADGQPAELYEELWKTIAAGNVWRGNLCNKRKNGEIYWEHASISPIRDERSVITHFVAIKEDITEDKRIAEELSAARDAAEAANRSKSEFLANMSHEIRTPLNAVIGFSALVLKSSLPPRQHDYVGKIHSAGELLLNIINDILDFSKIEARHLKMEQIPFRPDIVISNVVSMMQQKALDKGLNLLVETSPEVATCLIGDPHRLTQIIVNLLNNAVKFTERGEVALESMLLAEEDDRVQLKFSVRDTGIGLSPAQINKLFQPFTQADGSTTRKFGGTGLGLSISKQLVELMDGKIWCESVHGEGSSFCFTAWFGIAQGIHKEECLKISAAKSEHKGKSYNFSDSTILLVEDNETNRHLAIELLKETGAAVDIAVNGEEAVTLITRGSTQYDLVLMDIQMPVMDGYEATRLIRSDSRFITLPIIAMTAHAMLEERQKISQSGMNAHVTKPIDAQTMLRTIGSFLGGQDSTLNPRGQPDDEMGDDTVIPNIAGLDISGALTRLDGDNKLYLWSLRTFVKNESNAANVIGEALITGDTNLAHRQAHTIKGCAGSIGAVALEHLAQTLETAISEGAPSENIMSDLKLFAAEMERLVTELKIHLPVDPALQPGSINLAIVTPILNRLQDYIVASNGKAEYYLGDYQSELSGLPDNEIRRLKKHLTNFDFAAAHEALLALSSKIGVILTPE